MRPPPPVKVQLSDDTFWRAVRAVIPAAPVLAVALWLASLAGFGPWSILIAGCLALLVALSIDRRGRPGCIELSWDGRQWWCRRVGPSVAPSSPGEFVPGGAMTAVACEVRPAIRMDLGPWMLLSLQWVDPPAPGCPRWWAVSRRGAGTAWAGLRVALYCAPLGPTPQSPAR